MLPREAHALGVGQQLVAPPASARLPLPGSSPIESSPTRGSRHAEQVLGEARAHVRELHECSGRGSAFAPASSSRPARAGRQRLRDRRGAARPGCGAARAAPAATTAPVGPVETAAAARPSRTARQQTTSEASGSRADARPGPRRARSTRARARPRRPGGRSPPSARQHRRLVTAQQDVAARRSDGLAARPRRPRPAPGRRPSRPGRPRRSPTAKSLGLAAARSRARCTSCTRGTCGAGGFGEWHCGQTFSPACLDAVGRAAIVAAGLRGLLLGDGHRRGCRGRSRTGATCAARRRVPTPQTGPPRQPPRRAQSSPRSSPQRGSGAGSRRRRPSLRFGAARSGTGPGSPRGRAPSAASPAPWRRSPSGRCRGPRPRGTRTSCRPRRPARGGWPGTPRRTSGVTRRPRGSAGTGRERHLEARGRRAARTEARDAQLGRAAPRRARARSGLRPTVNGSSRTLTASRCSSPTSSRRVRRSNMAVPTR